MSCTKVRQYFQDERNTAARINMIQPEAYAPAVLPGYGYARNGTGGSAVMPTSANEEHNGNPRIVPNSAGATIGANFVDYYRVPLATTYSAGDNINGQIFARLSQSVGSTAPALGIPAAQQIRYLDNLGGVQVLGANISLVAPAIPGLYVADLQINMGAPLPADFVDFVDFSLTYLIPGGAPTGYDYELTTPPGDESIPVYVNVTYNDSPFTTVTEILYYDGVNPLLKSFTAATDPIAGYGGTFVINSVTAAANAGLPFPGWIYEFKYPFAIIGVGDATDVQTGGPTAYTLFMPYILDKATQSTWGNLMVAMKVAFNDANIRGIDNANILADRMAYIEGDFSKYLTFFNWADNAPEAWQMIFFEATFLDFWSLSLTLPQDDYIVRRDMQLLAESLANTTDKRMWGAPGKYFIPDFAAVGSGPEPPYWNGFNTYGGVKPKLVVLENRSIG